jgi:hypothetical protein
MDERDRAIAEAADLRIQNRALRKNIVDSGYPRKVLWTTTPRTTCRATAPRALASQPAAESTEPIGLEEEADRAVRVVHQYSSVPHSAPNPYITEQEVLACQAAWVSAIKSISKVYKEGGDFVQCAAKAASELYGYGYTNVLFKPTKAVEERFRPTGESAMSYFVGGKNVEDGIAEDGGFAINGGKGWSNVVFSNHQIDLNGNTAIAMGTYDFTDATDGSKTTVEYTFGYRKNHDGKVRIFLHHSSVPYSASAAAAVAKEEVFENKVAAVVLPSTGTSLRSFKDRSSRVLGNDGSSRETLHYVGQTDDYLYDLSRSSSGKNSDNVRDDGAEPVANLDGRTPLSPVQRLVDPWHNANKASPSLQAHDGEENQADVSGTERPRFERPVLHKYR